jgi:hypothetical protein
MRFKIFLLLFAGFAICIMPQTITSPGGKFTLTFKLTANGEPAYSLQMSGKPVIKESKLGLKIQDKPGFTNGCVITKTDTTSFDETWKPVWGEVKEIRNHYKELCVTLTQPDVKNRYFLIRFRLFDDGLGFRYEFPEQPELQYFTVTDEVTEFALAGNHKTFWIPGDFDSQEYRYTTTRLSEINAYEGKNVDEIGVKTLTADNLIQTPLMMKSDDGYYMNIHEAALVNYPAMHIAVDRKNFVLTSQLVPNAVGTKAYLQTPFTTPWRTIIASAKAEDILASKLILNLNEPTKYTDVSWIKPMKFVGIWWGMHVGTNSWNYADVSNVDIEKTDWTKLTPNGHHGATTENTKKYIDFAAKHKIGGVLVEGWNVGWEDWSSNWKENVFDFVTPYPDFNVDELQKYAAEKGVQIIMHHETSSSVTNYERRMDAAYRFMKAHGYNAVKTGYVGKIIPRGERHDGQWMVNHYNYVAKKTGENKIMVDSHESVRLTGMHRTYPNWIAAEAARGNEFNAWSKGNLPEHETILPFTRLMGGPMDYTPGIFQVKMSYYDKNKKECVHTTLTKQLALYVTMYSPLQMAADLIENYERFPDAFQFIEDVAVDWDDTKIVEAEPGDYITIARKAKNSENWFIGTITDENGRNASIPLNYLNAGQKYVASIYMDAPDADWDKNPMAYKIEHYIVDAKDVLKIKVAPGGGAAISLMPAGNDDLSKYKKY